ncbi:MAG: hypothetical protein ACRDO4_01125, partial [Nocardioides sp.]
MSFEDTITRSIEDHVDPVFVPPMDVAAVRRSGERRRAATTAVASLGVLAVITGGFALATGGGSPSETRIQPAELPALDFDQGLRAYYDDIKEELHLGGKAFELKDVPNLDISSSATPHGVVYVVDGEVRLLEEDGDVRVLLTETDADAVSSTVKFDAVAPVVAWLTRGDDGVSLVEYEFQSEATEALLFASVPCEGDGCKALAVAGLDHGKVFVRRLDRDETLVFQRNGDVVTLEGFRVADVRNRVVLGEGTPPTGDPLGKGWRFVEAEGPESLLTFDGGHELYWSSTLRSTDGGEPLVLDVPAKGTEFVNLDSDGSILIAVASGAEPQRYFDFEVPSGTCTPIGTLRRTSGDPIFLGND